MKNCFKLIDETAKQLPMNTAAAAVFNRVALLDALKRVAPATCRKSSVLPILQNVLFNVQKDGSAIITATNLELSVSVTLATEARRNVLFTVPFAPLLKAVRLMRCDRIGFSPGENTVVFESGSVSVTAHTCPAADYPQMESVLKMSIRNTISDSVQFFDDMERAQKCTSQDGLRQVLTGVYLKKEYGRAVVTGTDGKRLLIIESTEMAGDDVNPAILPGKFIPALKTAFAGKGGALTVDFYESHIVMESSNIRVALKKIEGSYPNAKQVIPVSLPEKLHISAFVLEWLINCAELVRDENNYLEMYLKPGRLELKTESCSVDAIGAAFCNLESNDYAGDREFHFTFNPDFLRMATLAGDDLTISFQDPLSPVMFSSPGRCYVLMPVRKK